LSDSKLPVIFLDDGGVMNDNERRGADWRRLVGQYFAPRLGGSPEEWARANVIAAERYGERYLQTRAENPYLDHGADWVEANDLWLATMAEAVGVAVPADPAERQRLVEDASAFITRNVRAAFPGAIGVIRQLGGVGFRLYTASGEHSLELDGYLTGMGVRECFHTLYGPDLVQTSKAGPHYYERVFAHAGIAPVDALVVDDNESVLEWAASVGARTMLCRSTPPRSTRHGHVTSLSELPVALERSIV
jgi:beta-phosphoglucomutase-like phosphatase (HAD superfamily)